MTTCPLKNKINRLFPNRDIPAYKLHCLHFLRFHYQPKIKTTTNSHAQPKQNFKNFYVTSQRQPNPNSLLPGIPVSISLRQSILKIEEEELYFFQKILIIQSPINSYSCIFIFWLHLFTDLIDFLGFFFF